VDGSTLKRRAATTSPATPHSAITAKCSGAHPPPAVCGTKREPERRKGGRADRQRHHGRGQHARVDVHAERRHGGREHEHDVNHIFAKAGVRDRAQAVVYAYGHGLAEPPG
jgi:hypothetical protein